MPYVGNMPDWLLCKASNAVACGVQTVLLSEVQCSCAVLSASTDNAGAVLVMEVLEVVDARHDTGRDSRGSASGSNDSVFVCRVAGKVDERFGGAGISVQAGGLRL